MQTFTDNKGRQWSISIDGGHVLRCKRELGVNLPGLFAEECRPLNELVGDIEKLFGTLWILCESQADQAGIDEVAFVTGLGGDALGSAIEAFIEAVIDFFPQAAQRAALRASRQVDQKLTTTLMQKIADMFEKAQTTTIGDS